MTYITKNGNEVTKEQIQFAFDAGMARLVHHHIDGGRATSLALDGIDRNTKSACYSVWEEVWTTVPESVAEALDVAKN